MLISGGAALGQTALRAGLKIQRDEKAAPARRHLTASTSSPPSVSVLPLASSQTAPFARFHRVIFRGLASRPLMRMGAAPWGGWGGGDGSIRDGRKGLKANGKKIGRETKMAPKPDLIHLDPTLLLTDSVSGKTENCSFFFPPSLFSFRVFRFLKKALGCMGPDNAAAPVG